MQPKRVRGAAAAVRRPLVVWSPSGDAVYNVALRIDPNSLMHAAAFQLIRNVLHGCGTVIALRPEDNSAAATVDIVEAALSSNQPQDRIAQRCRIPSIVSELRVERIVAPESLEHEMLGELLEAQAAQVTSQAAEPTAAGLWQKSDNGKPVIWVLMSERNGTFEGAIAKIFPRPGDTPNQICTMCSSSRRTASSTSPTRITNTRRRIGHTRVTT